jgi:hypothetical protein
MTFNGYKMLVMDDYVARLYEVRKWLYPVERFWEWIPSPETERWARFFGYGEEVVEYKTYLIGNTILVHPAVYDQLKHQLEKPKP